MSVAKLRPVGSRVPALSGPTPDVEFPWSAHYATVYVTSGTAALGTAARLSMALSKPNVSLPEIILPAYGCPDLVAAVLAYDIKPVLVDVSPGQPWMDPVGVETSITENTVAIVAVGFLGCADRIHELRVIADRFDISLIEDAAQVMHLGSSDDPVADFCVLSFGRGKPVNLMGGGALLIRRDHFSAASSIIDALEQIDLEFGLRWRLRRQVFNLLMRPVCYGALERIPQLGIGETRFKPLSRVYRLNNLEGLLKRGYARFLQGPALEAQFLEKFGFLIDQGWQFPLGSVTQRLLRFPLLAPSQGVRDVALSELNQKGIGASAFYGTSLPAIEGVSELIDAGPEDFPNAADFASRLLTLPIHEDVKQADIAVMSAALSSIPRLYQG